MIYTVSPLLRVDTLHDGMSVVDAYHAIMGDEVATVSTFTKAAAVLELLGVSPSEAASRCQYARIGRF